MSYSHSAEPMSGSWRLPKLAFLLDGDIEHARARTEVYLPSHRGMGGFGQFTAEDFAMLALLTPPAQRFVALWQPAHTASTGSVYATEQRPADSGVG